MPNSNSNNSIKRKFNVIDAMIIVIVLLLIVAVCFRSKINEIVSFDKRVSDYKISFKVSSISDSSYDYFLMEDSIWRNVYLDSPELLLGSIEGTPTKSPSTVYMSDEKGSIYGVEYPENSYVDISGQLRCSGIVKDDGCFYLSGNYVVSPGDVLRVHTLGLDFSLIVTDIGEF